MCETPTFFANSAYERLPRAFRKYRANSRSRFRCTHSDWQIVHHICVMTFPLHGFSLLACRAMFTMNPTHSRRQCRHCRKLFSPDHRNRYHQYYCSKPDCRRTSKAASQRRWLRKGSNRDYFRGPEQTLHVQQWRNAHPGYQKKRSPAFHSGQPSNSKGLKPEKTSCNARNSHLGALQGIRLTGYVNSDVPDCATMAWSMRQILFT